MFPFVWYKLVLPTLNSNAQSLEQIPIPFRYKDEKICPIFMFDVALFGNLYL